MSILTKAVLPKDPNLDPESNLDVSTSPAKSVPQKFAPNQYVEEEIPERHIFLPIERRLMNTIRWNRELMIKKRSVADHSYYVALWAPRVAQVIGWKHNLSELHILYQYALQHDMPEVVTGDTVGPFKKFYDHDAAEKAALVGRPLQIVRINDNLNAMVRGPEIRAIVKFCDHLEMATYLKEEQNLGNKGVGKYLAFHRDKMFIRWMALPWGRDGWDDIYKRKVFMDEFGELFSEQPLDA